MNARKNTCDLIQLVDEGYLDPKTVLISALNWMSDDEVEEFALANEYILEEDEEDLDDQDDQ